MDFDSSVNIIMSLIFGIIISLLFFYTFKPRYVIIKNNNNN